MARNFNMVSPKLWRSRRFLDQALEARLLYLYLLTCEHATSAGCYRLLPGYACADLGGWQRENYDHALSSLAQAGMIEADSETQEVLITRWFQHSPPMNRKHYAGTMKLVLAIESARLRQTATKALDEAWQAVQVALSQRDNGTVTPLSRALRDRIGKS
ncbi:MAG: hypothetical protein JO256_09200 [Alphaproteobacteria bacterium]|nr:hypothetical protein [Alphaproteobacteria bacterium]